MSSWNQTVVTACALAASLYCSAAQAETPPRPNALYFELFGPGGVATVNYERLLAPDWALRVGFGLLAAAGESGSDGRQFELAFSMPVTAEWFGVGNDTHRLLLGAGVVPVVVTGDSSFYDFADDIPPVMATALVGYRFQRPDRPFQFRLTTGAVMPAPSWPISPILGLSFGRSF